MKNLANFKIAVKTREYLIQAIFQMLFSDQEAAEIINQFKNEHQDKKVDFAMFTKSLNSSGSRLGGPHKITFAPQAVNAHKFERATRE